MNLPILTILAALTVAATSGVVGSFALMKRMSLAADAISHVALPGIGLAILLSLNPLVGGAAALLLAAVLIWALERRTRLAVEIIIGVVFSASLAVGSLIIKSEEELLDILFGDFGNLGFFESLLAIVVATLIMFLILNIKAKLTLAIISPDLAKTVRLNISKINLVFLLAFVITVILGLKVLGVLLMGSLIIVPAAAAKNFARSLSSDLLFAVLISVSSVILGLIFAQRFALAAGPAIISVASALFFLSLLFKGASSKI